MKKTAVFLAAAAFLLASGCVSWNSVSDNFSKHDWQVKANTVNGKISYSGDGLHLFNHIGDPGYCAAWKDFEVDFDATPFFSVELAGERVNGLVRLQIDGKPRQEILQFTTLGVFSVNAAEKLKITGRHQVRVLLYNLSLNRTATFKKIRFSAEKPEAAPVKERVKRTRVVPSFNSASYYISTPKLENITVTFRELPGGKWQKAFPPIRDEVDGNYRGSIVNLKEARNYILRVTDGKKLIYEKKFHTASPTVPVGRTILLNAKNYNGYLKKIISGTPDSWVRYAAAPGFVLTNDGKTPLIEIDRAKYVIFEGLTLKGGNRRAVAITNSSNIRFINCDVSGWGRKGVQRFDLDGKYFADEKSNDAINTDGAFDVSECRNVVIERCFVHDPRGRANSWQFSHPAGPQAVVLYRCTGTVIRYNDFVGSDEHRFNDAVEGRGNFEDEGGINRDADVNGNFMIFTSDDCIELDGGQHNVRCFGNRFEGGYCGVSIQGCMKGPSYVFDNLFSNMSDEFGLNGLSLKINSGTGGKYARSFIFNNTFAGTGSGTVTIKHLPVEFYNNIFADDNNLFLGRHVYPNDNNLVTGRDKGHGKNTIVSQEQIFTAPELGNYSLSAGAVARDKAKKLDNFSRGPHLGAMQSDSCGEQLPRRPIPAKTDASTLYFSEGETSRHFSLIGRNDTAFRKSFTIAKPEAADWFEVTPSSGMLHTGQTITFEVKIKKERMHERENWRGAFLIRFDDGLSRPVAVYAKGKPVRLAPAIKKYNASVTFIEAENPVSGAPHAVISDPTAGHGKALDFKAVKYNSYKALPTDPKLINVYEFTVPKDGIYTIALRLRAEPPSGMHDSIYLSVDSEKLTRVDFGKHIRKEWHWCVPAGLKKNTSTLGALRLKAGKHTLRIAPREQVFFDAIAVSDDIRVFLNW